MTRDRLALRAHSLWCTGCGTSRRCGTRQHLPSAAGLELRQWADDEYPAGVVG